jgi:SAM-dependent methyltransferase
MLRLSVRPVHDRRARLASSVHSLLQSVEGALFGAYVRSVRAQARLSGFPLPVTQLGIQRGSGLGHGRGVGTFARWAAIEKELPAAPGLALDIGSHTGFFSLALAERGFLVLGCEPSRRLYRIANAAADGAGQPSVAFMPIAVEPANVATLPQADIVLVLSVFHDWCERFGFERSLEMLDTVWQKTKTTLFFEMPNTVENSSVRTVLPDMGASPEAAKDYIESLLSRLVGGDVALLGHFATDFRGEGERRHLFAVRRSA